MSDDQGHTRSEWIVHFSVRLFVGEKMCSIITDRQIRNDGVYYSRLNKVCMPHIPPILYSLSGTNNKLLNLLNFLSFSLHV